MKKITALLLAVLMLALPVMSLAASPVEMIEAAVAAGQPLNTRISFRAGTIPGLDADAAAIIDEMLGALSIETDEQQGDAPQTDFAVQLLKDGEQADVLTLSFATKGEDMFIKSNFLGAEPLAMTPAESEVLLERLVNMAVEGGMLSESDVEEIKQAIDQAAAQVPQIDEAAMEADMDMTGVIEAAAKLVEKAKVEEVTAQPKNCDAAATMVTISLTAEDIAQVYDEIFAMLKNNEAFMQGFAAGFEGAVASSGESMTAEEVFDKAPEAIREALAMLQGDVPVVLYLDEAGEPVYATVSMAMKAENENGDVEAMNMDMSYARLTVNEGVTHSANVIGKEDNGTGVAISVNVFDNEKLNTVNVGIDSLEGDVAEPVVTVAVQTEKDYGETESEEEMDIVVNVYDSEDADEFSFRVEIDSEAEQVAEGIVRYEAEAELYVMGLEEEIFTVMVNQVTGAAAESIAVDSAVRPGAMNDEEFASFVEGVGNEALMSLVNLLQCLPDSVLGLLMM